MRTDRDTISLTVLLHCTRCWKRLICRSASFGRGQAIIHTPNFIAWGIGIRPVGRNKVPNITLVRFGSLNIK